jgi:hypothetical protein
MKATRSLPHPPRHGDVDQDADIHHRRYRYDVSISQPGSISYPVSRSSGYIGGAVLERLLQHRTAPNSQITALVRNAAKIPLFASIGVKTVDGSLDDGALLERQAFESDVVFACVSFFGLGRHRLLTMAV